jgi:hypothetical protein
MILLSVGCHNRQLYELILIAMGVVKRHSLGWNPIFFVDQASLGIYLGVPWHRRVHKEIIEGVRCPPTSLLERAITSVVM